MKVNELTSSSVKFIYEDREVKGLGISSHTCTSALKPVWEAGDHYKETWCLTCR